MNILDYQDSTAEIYLLNTSTQEKTMLSDMASKPVFNKSNTKAVFISPLEWECVGDTFIVDLATGECTKLALNISDDVTPKFAEWIDDEHFLLIVGYVWGTIQIGGNIYMVNVNNLNVKLIEAFPSKIQVTSIEMIADNNVLYTGIEYVDDYLNKSIPYTKIKSIQSILEQE